MTALSETPESSRPPPATTAVDGSGEATSTPGGEGNTEPRPMVTDTFATGLDSNEPNPAARDRAADNYATGTGAERFDRKVPLPATDFTRVRNIFNLRRGLGLAPNAPRSVPTAVDNPSVPESTMVVSVPSGATAVASLTEPDASMTDSGPVNTEGGANTKVTHITRSVSALVIQHEGLMAAAKAAGTGRPSGPATAVAVGTRRTRSRHPSQEPAEPRGRARHRSSTPTNAASNANRMPSITGIPTRNSNLNALVPHLRDLPNVDITRNGLWIQRWFNVWNSIPLQAPSIEGPEFNRPDFFPTMSPGLSVRLDDRYYADRHSSQSIDYNQYNFLQMQAF